MASACQLDINLNRSWVARDACQLDIDIPQAAATTEPESALVSAAWHGSPVRGRPLRYYHTDKIKPRRLADELTTQSLGEPVTHCHDWGFTAPTYFAADTAPSWQASQGLTACLSADTPPPGRFSNDISPTFGGAVAISHCNLWTMPFAPRLVSCQRSDYAGSAGVGNCQAHGFGGVFVDNCLIAKNSDTIQPPCEYHRVVIDTTPPEPTEWVCGERDSPCNLSINLDRRRAVIDPCALPIDFACTLPPAGIPTLRSYLMLNTSTLTFDGRTVDFFSANVRTDASSWCWQLTVSVPPAVFALFDIDGRTDANPAIVDLHINGYDWRFMLDDYSDNRVFGKKTYTVTGYSQTAQLAGKNAARSRIYTTALYARQIADAELDLTGFAISGFNSVDWLVPGGAYSYSEQTPMAVINDIADAAGCYVQSHRVDKTLSIHKRLPVPTWRLATATPAVIVPPSVIYGVSGRRNTSRRCNGIFVHGQSNGVIVDAIINASDGTPRLATKSHALITDEAVGRQAAEQALTATGRHKTETLTLPLTLKYNILLAEMGQLWQVDEADSWLGQVVSVGVTVERNSSHKVTQQVGLDNYLGEGND